MIAAAKNSRNRSTATGSASTITCGSATAVAPARAISARSTEGVTVEAGRIEVRFAGAKEAVGKLFALAKALVHDYERFEKLVGKGERSG